MKLVSSLVFIILSSACEDVGVHPAEVVYELRLIDINGIDAHSAELEFEATVSAQDTPIVYVWLNDAERFEPYRISFSASRVSGIIMFDWRLPYEYHSATLFSEWRKQGVVKSIVLKTRTT